MSSLCECMQLSNAITNALTSIKGARNLQSFWCVSLNVNTFRTAHVFALFISDHSAPTYDILYNKPRDLSKVTPSSNRVVYHKSMASQQQGAYANRMTKKRLHRMGSKDAANVTRLKRCVKFMSSGTYSGLTILKTAFIPTCSRHNLKHARDF